MAFILDRFKDMDFKDPTDPNHGFDLRALAVSFAEAYREEKTQSKEPGRKRAAGASRVHHPIFRGKPINYDPRERFIADFMAKQGDYSAV